MRNRVREVRCSPGRIAVRLWGADVWLCYNTPVDSLIAHVVREVGGFPSRHQFCVATGIHQSHLVKVLEKGLPLPPLWLLKLHDMSGIPLAELRLVAGAAPMVPPHPVARKERKPHLMPKLPEPSAYFSAS